MLCFYTNKNNHLAVISKEYKRHHVLFRSKLSFWKSDQSNTINGSDGSAFHPLLTKDERIFIFTPDLCRYIGEDFQPGQLLLTLVPSDSSRY